MTASSVPAYDKPKEKKQQNKNHKTLINRLTQKEHNKKNTEKSILTEKNIQAPNQIIQKNHYHKNIKKQRKQ